MCRAGTLLTQDLCMLRSPYTTAGLMSVAASFQDGKWEDLRYWTAECARDAYAENCSTGYSLYGAAVVSQKLNARCAVITITVSVRPENDHSYFILPWTDPWPVVR